MADLRELYQEQILDHCKRPRNHRSVAEPSHVAEGHNPLCGDRVKVALVVVGDRIADIGFEGQGCAISVASASMMTEALSGATLVEADRTFQAFHALVAGDVPPTEPLGKLVVFAGVREFPVRVKCATLAWHTLRAALAGAARAASTE